MSRKKAMTDHPIHELIAARWSPYSFEERPVRPSDLASIFEAARWSASSYNEQPWSFIVATADEQEEFERMLSCLGEWNQGWAKAAPVLVLAVTNQRFAKNGKENRAAVYDLGQAVANLVIEATARGLSVHQMAGILPDKAREIYQIPEHADVWTALAIGYRGEAAALPDALKEKDLAARERKPLAQFVFSGRWGHSDYDG